MRALVQSAVVTDKHKEVKNVLFLAHNRGLKIMQKTYTLNKAKRSSKKHTIWPTLINLEH